MKKYIFMLFSILLIVILFFIIHFLKQGQSFEKKVKGYDIGEFNKQKKCAKQPKFLKTFKIPQPVAIDLSQQNHKGLAFLYGRSLHQNLHLKSWEQFDHFSNYTLDPQGNMYLSPMPFISIKQKTFEFQKNIYKLDTNSGNLSIWMTLEGVKATETNPYGIIAVEYDCDDDTLWVATIDETDYFKQRGVLYHIDVKSKKVLQEINGIDALSLKLLRTQQGKYLLYGSARESALFVLNFKNQKIVSMPTKLFDLSDANIYIRKIKIREKNILKVETIPFSYSLIAQATSQIRNDYNYLWDTETKSWVLSP